MKITGPFKDPGKRGQPKEWYLRIVLPVILNDGTLALDEKGRVKKRRERPYYPTKAAAEADKPRLAAQHNAAGAGSGGLLTRDQVTEFEEAKKIAGEASLPDLARFWRKHHPLTHTLRVREHAKAVLEQLELRRGKNNKQVEDLKSRLKTFAASFGDRIPETITRKEIVDWLFTFPGKAKSGRTVINLKQSVCTFFNILRTEGVMKENPAGGIKRRELPRWVPREIGFLSLAQSEAYLRAAERYDPELVAHEAIQLLAGVRADDEMAQFRGDWVLPETREIVIPAEIAKTETREVITEMEPVFWEWWEAYGRKGLLRPKSHMARWSRIRMLATIATRERADELARVSMHQVTKLPETAAAVKAWPWNARRRTFATFHVAKHQSADKTALIMRHRGDTYTLHNSYRGMGVTQAQGAEYFSRRPQPVAAPIAPAAGTMPPRGIVKQRAAMR